MIEKLLAFAERQAVEDGGDEAMRNVVTGEAIFAGAAAHVGWAKVIRHAAVGAVSGNSARTDLCGGRSAMAVPTATPLPQLG